MYTQNVGNIYYCWKVTGQPIALLSDRDVTPYGEMEISRHLGRGHTQRGVTPWRESYTERGEGA